MPSTIGEKVVTVLPLIFRGDDGVSYWCCRSNFLWINIPSLYGLVKNLKELIGIIGNPGVCIVREIEGRSLVWGGG